MAKKAFKVYPRGNFYYFQLLEEDGGYTTPHSTRIPALKPKQIAEQAVIAALAQGTLQKKRDKTIPNSTMVKQIQVFLVSHGLLPVDRELPVDELIDLLSLKLNGVSFKQRNPLFVEYLLRFWDWEKSDYIQGKLAGGFKIGKSYVSDYLARVKNHAVPFFDPGLRIKDVTTGLLEDFKKYLLTRKVTPHPNTKTAQEDMHGLSTKTIAEIIQTVAKPLKEAKRLGLISVNPADAMTSLAKRKKPRGILTPEEVRKLFATEWRNERTKLANKLAACTGMRAGEIGALRPADIRIVGGKGLVTVSRSYERRQKIVKGTKSEKTRTVCVPPDLIDELLYIHGQNPHESKEFIFWGTLPDRPMFLRSFIEDLCETMERIGISPEEQKKRNLVFHSWRHFVNATLRGSVPDTILRKVIGHEDEAMTDNYDHVTEEQIDSLYKAVEVKILPFVRRAG